MNRSIHRYHHGDFFFSNYHTFDLLNIILIHQLSRVLYGVSINPATMKKPSSLLRREVKAVSTASANSILFEEIPMHAYCTYGVHIRNEIHYPWLES